MKSILIWLRDVIVQIQSRQDPPVDLSHNHRELEESRQARAETLARCEQSFREHTTH